MQDLQSVNANIPTSKSFGTTVEARPEASVEDVAVFARALREGGPEEGAKPIENPNGRHDLESGEMRSKAEHSAKEKSEDLPQPKALLASLFEGMTTFASDRTEKTSGTVAPTEAPADIEGLERLVSRILISAPDSGRAEVRLQVNESVLRGTEISLSRDHSGQLFVKITTNDATSYQTILAARTELTQRLDAKESLPVRIDLQNETDREEGDARRRSRGRNAYRIDE